MRQPWQNPLSDLLSLLRVLRIMCGYGFENENLSPLIRFIDRGQELVQILSLMKFEITFICCIGNFKKRGASICNHDSISVLKQSLEQFDHLLLFHDFGRDAIELRYSDSSCLLHIRIMILQTIFETLREFLSDFLDSDAAHRPDG